jgi:hypothetical protein
MAYITTKLVVIHGGAFQALWKGFINGDWTGFRFILDMARHNAGFHDSLLGVGWLREAVGVAQTAAVEKPTIRWAAAERTLQACYLRRTKLQAEADYRPIFSPQ